MRNGSIFNNLCLYKIGDNKMTEEIIIDGYVTKGGIL